MKYKFGYNDANEWGRIHKILILNTKNIKMGTETYKTTTMIILDISLSKHLSK